ncbi:MAG: HU family DNA-binding protein [Bdellovibrionales bacterium]|nr:HU family DNA-binding protein [Bdellovibrionales bacterium]
MNKSEIISKIAESTNIPKKEVETVITSFFDTVKNSLKNNENVKLIGFGTFSSNERKARAGRNPQTGQTINIPSYFYPKFKPGREFKEYLN